MKYSNTLSGLFVGLIGIAMASQSIAIERVSVSSLEEQGNSGSRSPTISADGRYIAFSSSASNLVPGDTNNASDVFIRDRETGRTELISVSSNAEQGNSTSSRPSISDDGRYVAFESSASNLVSGDANSRGDIFIHDRDTGATELVSVSSNGEQGSDSSYHAMISADGRIVAFYSFASDLVTNDVNGEDDVFIHDRDTGITELVSVSSTGVQGNASSLLPSISANGRYVAFHSSASNLVPEDINNDSDVFIRDRDTGITELVSVSSTGEKGNSRSHRASISADGRFVAFSSRASNFMDGVTNGDTFVYVHDRDTRVTELVSVSSNGNKAGGEFPAVSSDGRFVAFYSFGRNLVLEDTNMDLDVFIHDRSTGETNRVSVSSNGDQGNRSSRAPSISGNGQHVSFDSNAYNLVSGDTNNVIDVFVTENILSKNLDMSAKVNPSSNVVNVGEYTRFRAKMTNTSSQVLHNCKPQIVNPFVKSIFKRRFSFYTWPLGVSNPEANLAVDIDPGQTAQMNLAVLARDSYRGEVKFTYICDNARALTTPFVNTVFLIAKTQPILPEDFVKLENSNNRADLVIDRNNGKYWAAYAVDVSNTGSETATVNLTTTSIFPDTILRQSQLCEPSDPANNNWSCINPRDTQLQVELAAGEQKKILVFVHAKQAIEKRVIQNRIYLEAGDAAGEVVAKTSMGISTIN